jgi:ACS family tartrate transporter-like MFS transporter
MHLIEQATFLHGKSPPLLVRDALHTADSTTAFITGAIALCGLVAFPVAGILSDRSGERCRLAALGLLVGTAGCIGVALSPHSALRIAALIAFPMTAAMVHTSFWCLPTRFLAGASAAAGIALINAIGNAGGFFGPTLVGVLRHATGSDTAALFMLAALEFSGALVCVALRRIAVFTPVQHAPNAA